MSEAVNITSYILVPFIIPLILVFNSVTQPIEYAYVNKLIYTLFWISFYVLLGYLLFETDNSSDKEIYWTTLTLIGASYVFLGSVIQYKKYLFIITLVMLYLAITILLELLFSDLVDDDTKIGRGYLHFMTPIIILIIYLLIYSSKQSITN